MIYETKVAELYDCCGIIVLHRLQKNQNPRPPSHWAATPDPEKNAKAWNEMYKTETEEEYLERIRKFITHNQKAFMLLKSYILISLNRREDTLLNGLMKELGFEVLVDWTKNPGGTEVILYKFDLMPKAKEEKKEMLA